MAALGGVSAPGGACSWGGGVCSQGGFLFPGGVCSGGGLLLRGVVFQHALRQTHACKNITFATSLRTVKKKPKENQNIMLREHCFIFVLFAVSVVCACSV